ncbi:MULTISPECIES: HlyD family secretion protein [Paracoccus]|uniref:HlyD family secretion protein n=1 Tax=Paracoccus TaxID=265 RepID=UPI002549D78A|nr:MULTISPECIES: HlyD family efflux transporter periplasmic adaptor subunit [unclassified Paracoccus (in: a-proteobacteria)]MDK8873891.1 HlyD family efflux transporter periplasmic adaptor subunit [Paracoccus sp. SSJ]
MNEQTPFFRREVEAARRSDWLGRPMLVNGPSAGAVALFSAAFVIAALCFVTFGDYTRRVRVSGVILPAGGLTRLVAPQPGWVSELAVNEGDRVRRGQMLYALDIDTATARGNTQDAVTDILERKRAELHRALAAQREFDHAARQRLQDQLASLGRELPQLRAQIETAEEFTRQLEDFAERQRRNLDRGMGLASDYESRLQALQAQRAELARLRREEVQLAGQRDALTGELAGFAPEAEARLAALQAQLLDVEQQLSEAEARRALRITAPRDGMVTAIITRAGQTVAEGTPLLTIVPDDQPLVAQLVAPGGSVGFLREGADVLLRYPAFPYQKFGQYPGRISVISRANLRGDEVADLAPAADPDKGPSLFRITVAPDRPFVMAYGKPEPLQAGMQVEAHLLLDSRPIWQWILEPLFGLKGAFAQAAPERPHEP